MSKYVWNITETLSCTSCATFFGFTKFWPHLWTDTLNKALICHWTGLYELVLRPMRCFSFCFPCRDANHPLWRFDIIFTMHTVLQQVWECKDDEVHVHYLCKADCHCWTNICSFSFKHFTLTDLWTQTKHMPKKDSTVILGKKNLIYFHIYTYWHTKIWTHWQIDFFHKP